MTSLSQLAAVTALGVSACVGTAPGAVAEPVPPEPVPVPAASAAAPQAPIPDGVVPSAEPGLFTTPEGWNLEVRAADETQVAVNPLTTAISSREYLASGTFTGNISGDGASTLGGGTLEVGYQIGCGIIANSVRLAGTAGITLRGAPLVNMIPAGVAFPITGNIEIGLRPGEVSSVPVTRKAFKGAQVRVSVSTIHIKIDGCAGQSFLRSYAVLTSKTDETDDVVAYYGITKSV